MIVTGGNDAGRLSAPAGQRQRVRAAAPELHLSGGRMAVSPMPCAWRSTLPMGSSICVVLGDNIIEGNICAAAKHSPSSRQRRQGAALRGARPRALRRPRALTGGTDRRDRGEAQGPPSNYAVIGIYFYDAEVFDIVRTLKPSHRGELEITDVNNAYLYRGAMTHDVIEGWWTDAGTFDSLLRASKLVAENGANRM